MSSVRVAPTWRRFVSLYHLAHVGIMALYLTIRFTKKSKALSELDNWLGLTRETEILVTMTMFLLQKYRRSTTLDQFMSQVLLYGKTGILVLMYFLDWRLMVWFAVIYGVIFMTIKPPVFDVAETCTILSGPEFESSVLAPGCKGTWLVMLTAPWSDTCSHALPLFSELSIRYSSPSLKFGKLDVSRWGQVSESLKIDVSINSHQLPSFLLVKEGQEVKRLPPVNEQGQSVKMSFDKNGLISYFDLDRLLLQEQEQTNAKKSK